MTGCVWHPASWAEPAGLAQHPPPSATGPRDSASHRHPRAAVRRCGVAGDSRSAGQIFQAVGPGVGILRGLGASPLAPSRYGEPPVPWGFSFPCESFRFVFPWRLRRLLPLALARALRAARAAACVAGRGVLPRCRPCFGFAALTTGPGPWCVLGLVSLAGTRSVPRRVSLLVARAAGTVR